jgi:hypothetical protein
VHGIFKKVIIMMIYTRPVKRIPWAQQVRVSKTQTGRWILDRGSNLSELPASTFTCWEHAEWTANALANQEYRQSVTDAE